MNYIIVRFAFLEESQIKDDGRVYVDYVIDGIEKKVCFNTKDVYIREALRIVYRHMNSDKPDSSVIAKGYNFLVNKVRRILEIKSEVIIDNIAIGVIKK